MKRIFSATTNLDIEYNVTIGFCGFIGVETERTIFAPADADKEDILYMVQEDYGDELLEGEVIEVDEDEYEVEVTFDGQIGSSEVYNVYASNEDEAIDDAIEEAKNDLEVIEFHEL